MATYVARKPTYFELKADMTAAEAEILERLVERRHSALQVVGDLQAGGRMSQSQAFARVRRLLRDAMAYLHPPGRRARRSP